MVVPVSRGGLHRAHPARVEESRPHWWPHASNAREEEGSVHPLQDDNKQHQVEPKVVLRAQRRRAAPGVHRQGAAREAGCLIVRGVAPRAPGEARGVHRRAPAPGEQGADRGHRHRQLPPAEGASPHGEEASSFPDDGGCPYEGTRMVEEFLSDGVSAQRAGRAVSQPPGGLGDLWGVLMRPDEVFIQLVSVKFRRWLSCIIFLP